MEALAKEGNAAEALRVYDELRMRLRDDLRMRLRDDLGVAPSPRTQELHVRLLG